MCPECALELPPLRPWIDCLFSVMLNLQQAYPNEKIFYHKEEICVFIDTYWKPLCGARERAHPCLCSVHSACACLIDPFGTDLSVRDFNVVENRPVSSSVTPRAISRSGANRCLRRCAISHFCS